MPMRRDDVRTTNHSIERALGRVGGFENPADASGWLRRAWAEGTKLPGRYARSLGRRRTPRRRRKGDPIFRVYGDVVLVGRGRLVITCWRLDDDALAAVFVWVAMGIWVPPTRGMAS
jgi:hypothetical protein